MRRSLFHLPWRSAQRIDEDVDEELRFHLAVREEELVARGLSAEQAHAEAERQFGDMDDTRRYLQRYDRSTETARRWSDYLGEFRYDRCRRSAAALLDIDGKQVPIIGVVGNVRQVSVEEPAQPAMFIHSLQNMRDQANLVVRTRGEPLAMAAAVQHAIWDLDRDQTITSIFTLSSAVGDAVARPWLLTTLLMLFGALGLLIGGIGLYGVLAYFVMQRRREIGVRVALGADAGRVQRMVVGRGLSLAVAGILAGLAGALLLSRFMRSILFGVGTTDPATFAGATLVLLGIALLASWIPARRAARVDPLVAMLAE